MCFIKIGVSKDFTKLTKNTCARVSFLIKLRALAYNFIKKRPWHKFLPVNFMKLSWTTFLQNTYVRLLLILRKSLTFLSLNSVVATILHFHGWSSFCIFPFINDANWILCWPTCSQRTLSLTFENVRKPHGFLMFSGGRERVHWEQVG